MWLGVGKVGGYVGADACGNAGDIQNSCLSQILTLLSFPCKQDSSCLFASWACGSVAAVGLL